MVRAAKKVATKSRSPSQRNSKAIEKAKPKVKPEDEKISELQTLVLDPLSCTFKPCIDIEKLRKIYSETEGLLQITKSVELTIVNKKQKSKYCVLI